FKICGICAMKILPIAFDSLGVRSMATYVETDDIRIFIDPGVSIAPDRYSLPPHRIELDRHQEMWKAIKHWVGVSDIIIITQMDKQITMIILHYSKLPILIYDEHFHIFL
ncbi:unnamed protein product, partial [marine sediment metagenome]